MSNLRTFSSIWAAAAALAGTTLLTAGGAWAQTPAEIMRLYGPTYTSPAPAAEPANCHIDEKIAFNWISRVDALKPIYAAYENAIKTFDETPLDRFGPSGGKDRGANRDKAKADLVQAGDQLLNIAKTYAARQFASCDQCYLFENWGKLGRIALESNGKPVVPGGVLVNTGEIFMTAPQPQSAPGALQPTAIAPQPQQSVNIKTITRAQIENQAVLDATNAMIRLMDDYGKLPILVAGTQKDCADGTKLPTPDKNGEYPNCSQAMILPYLAFYRNKVVVALGEAQSAAQKTNQQSETMESIWRASQAKSPRLDCTPERPTFPHVNFIRRLF